MKTNNDMLHGGTLRPDFAQAWANYYTKFIKAYEREAIPPTMKRQGLGDRKIIAWDHNRDLICQRVSTILADPNSSQYVWGIGDHWYEPWSGESRRELLLRACSRRLENGRADVHEFVLLHRPLFEVRPSWREKNRLRVEPKCAALDRLRQSRWKGVGGGDEQGRSEAHVSSLGGGQCCGSDQLVPACARRQRRNK